MFPLKMRKSQFKDVACFLSVHFLNNFPMNISRNRYFIADIYITRDSHSFSPIP